MSEEQIEMTPERQERLDELIVLTQVFMSARRQRLLTAYVIARALTNDEVYNLVKRAATDDFPAPFISSPKDPSFDYVADPDPEST